MTICRYFAKGNCRYGDRCRFEHVVNAYNEHSYDNDQWNTGNHEDRYGSYNRYDNEHRNQRYESRNYYNVDYQGYGSDRYNEKFARSSNQNNQYQYRNRQNYDQQFRSNEQHFGKKKNQYSYDYGM